MDPAGVSQCCHGVFPKPNGRRRWANRAPMGQQGRQRARCKSRLGALAAGCSRVAGPKTAFISAETYWPAAPGQRGIDGPVGPGARLMFDRFLT
jgi:hypothetical protein